MSEDEHLYRRGVGIMLLNADREVWVGRRIDNPGDAWQMPQGGMDEGEEPWATALRELEEETGWRPGRIEHLLTFQPMIGSADSANHVYAAYDCTPTNGVIDINEGVEVHWVGLQEAEQLVKKGEIIGAASVVAISELKARATTRR